MTIASLAIMVAAFGGAYAQTIQDAAEAYNAAGESITAKKYIDAIPYLEDAIMMAEMVGAEGEEIVREAKKLLPGINFQAGGQLIQAGKPEEAIVYFERAVVLAEEMEDVRILSNAKGWVARTYDSMGAGAFNAKDYATAAEIFQKGYTINPDFPALALHLGQSYGELKEYDKAYDIFRNVISLEQHGDKYTKEVAEAREHLANYTKLNANEIAASEPARAIEILSLMVADTPDPVAYALLVQTANNSKNYDKVIEFGEKAIEVQTEAANISNINFWLGSAYDNKYLLCNKLHFNKVIINTIYDL